MDRNGDWDDYGTDEVRPIPIGDLLPGVLARYGLDQREFGGGDQIRLGHFPVSGRRCEIEPKQSVQTGHFKPAAV
jgi:hypothetical protein